MQIETPFPSGSASNHGYQHPKCEWPPDINYVQTFTDKCVFTVTD